MASSAASREAVEAQLEQLDLLQAMYPDELHFDQHDKTLLDNVRDWCTHLQDYTQPIPDCIVASLDLPISEIGSQKQSITLRIDVPLQPWRSASDADAWQMRVRILQPVWLSKVQVAQLASMSTGIDVLDAIEAVKDGATEMQRDNHKATVPSETFRPAEEVIRVWFYFPSISTREKRNDLVTYAPRYGLTGFLLAGKPGVLCLEGTSTNIDDYMKVIKTESWRDIPSQHKKVSERYRETDPGLTRRFSDMQEITDLLEKRGERANRGDMKALEAWLKERQLDSAFDHLFLGRP